MFRRLIEEYERDNNVPMADIAAAFALQSRWRRILDDRAAAASAEAERPERTGAIVRRGRLATTSPLIASPSESAHWSGPAPSSGHWRRVGAVCTRSDFRAHQHQARYRSLVELPAQLSKATLKALEQNSVSGVLIDLKRDRGRPSHDHSGGKPRADRDVRAQRRESGGLERIAGADRVPSCAHRGSCARCDTGGRHAAYTTGSTHGYAGLGVRVWRSVCRYSSSCRAFAVRSVGEGHVAGTEPPSLSHAWHRVRRIMPAYAVTVLAAFALYHFREAGPNPGHTWWGCCVTSTDPDPYTDNYMFSHLRKGSAQMEPHRLRWPSMLRCLSSRTCFSRSCVDGAGAPCFC